MKLSVFSPFCYQKCGSWVNIADRISPAMLSLIFDIDKINSVLLRKKYGNEIANFFTDKETQIENNISDIRDKKYYIPIEYKLALVKKPKDADILLSSGFQGKVSGTVIDVPKDPSSTHPYRQKDCINQIKEKINKGIVFNAYDFQVILHKENIKGNSKYHYYHQVFGNNSYSSELINFIVRKIQADPGYFSKTRVWFKQNHPKRKKTNL